MRYGCRLFNDGWEFMRLAPDAGLAELEEQTEKFVPVGIPHDWLIERADRLYEDGSGWYRRFLDWDGDPEQEVVLRFEGIYMDSTVFVNRKAASEWKYGYSTFEADITPYLSAGRNEILVRAVFRSPNSRWYSGAGIYRDVWLKLRHRAGYLVSDGTLVTVREKTEGIWELKASTEVSAKASLQERLWVEYRLTGTDTGTEVLRAARPIDGQGAEYVGDVISPEVWDINRPARYRLLVRLMCGEEEWQRESYTVGFRTIAFSPEEGFLLNHRKVKLNGVCEHHDLGCLGAAYSPAAMRRRLKLLRGMGVNALRLAHNMPAPDVMEQADEMGFLVVSEAFDMWERPKNAFDYARFFPEWWRRDVKSWVRRDRNHPSLIMWSIGNEIYDTHAGERGQELTRLLAGEVRRHDPDGHAGVTLGSNYMPWENAQKCADIVKLAGYNYAEKYYQEHHRKHPDWVIYGSETGSVVSSRGVYHFPYSSQILADEDGQCSSLGNSSTSWGARSAESCILAEREAPFSCGQFLWTGFDYIGEPTPYHTRSSYFGQLDTAGFPKDSYYIYQAAWTDWREHPMVHVFPYWDFNRGQAVDVRVCSNAPRVELFLNGKSLGSRSMDRDSGTYPQGHWQISFEPGKLCARAYDEEGNLVAQESRSSFGEAARIVMAADRNVIRGDGRDMAFVEISVLDGQGRPVENAVNRIRVSVTGKGYLAGLDNGDSTDTEEYKTDSRRLFGGRLLAVVAAGKEPGEISVTAESFGLASASLAITAEPAEVPEGTGEDAHRVRAVSGGEKSCGLPLRAVRLTAREGTLLTAEHPETEVCAALCPADASCRELIWKAVDDAGIPSPLAQVEPSEDTGRALVRALGDGRFRLRCMSRAGTEWIRVISELDFRAEGFGRRWLDPYGFIAGGLYDYSWGETGNGNEHGVATARDGETQVGFHGLDFGPFGSDLITLPIFCLDDDPCSIQIWEGMPGEEGSRLAADVIYQKPSVWNTY